jgi:hypothetical protein
MPEGEGEKLPASVVAYRLEVLETVLSAGDAVEKIDNYKPLFERNGFSLTPASHMRQLIPVLARRHLEAFSLEVKGKFVSVIFDGTDHFGELLLVYVRFWNGEEWIQRLIKLRHSEHPLDNRSLAFILDRACIAVGINPNHVLGFIKDSVALNGLAVTKLRAEADYIFALSVPCFSHIIAREGKRFKLELALGLIKTWSNFFSVSLKVMLII